MFSLLIIVYLLGLIFVLLRYRWAGRAAEPRMPLRHALFAWSAVWPMLFAIFVITMDLGHFGL